MLRTTRRDAIHSRLAQLVAGVLLTAWGSETPGLAADAPAGATQTPPTAQRLMEPGDVPVKREIVLPEGVGPVKLGMRLEEARAAMPELQIDENAMAGANPPLPFKYAVARLRDQPFGDLRGCEITLHFYRDRFIYYGVNCPDVAATRNYLLTAFGAPGAAQPDVWQWTTMPRSMTFVPTSGAIAVAENEGVRAYQLELLNLPRLRQQGAGSREGSQGGVPSGPGQATPQP